MAEFRAIQCDGGRDGLECDHCGNVATWPDDDGAFDDSDACASCGFPGHASFDDEGPRWNASQAPGAACDRDDCEECGTWRGERI